MSLRLLHIAGAFFLTFFNENQEIRVHFLPAKIIRL
jgi:hypothetical protein